ncbi:MAG: hydrolase [Candidatus Saccharibacteria bacterium]|nr:hydrolase [Candidatus Saccharibacteria bacterium]
MGHTMFTAKALVFDSNGDFLLLKRSDTHPFLAGFYDLPGGIIEDGEEPGDAVVREINEEVGLNVMKKDIQIFYATTKFINNKSIPTLLYAVHIDSEKPDITISWEHKSYEWAPIERLHEVEPQLAPAYGDALNYILDNDILDILKTSD